MRYSSKVSSKVLLLVSSLLLTTYAQAETDGINEEDEPSEEQIMAEMIAKEIKKENEFIALLHQSEDRIKSQTPTWQYKSASSYKIRGAESLSALLENISSVDNLNDICRQGLGSHYLCTNGAYFHQFPLKENDDPISIPVDLQAFKSEGINSLIAKSLKNEENLSIYHEDEFEPFDMEEYAYLRVSGLDESSVDYSPNSFDIFKFLAYDIGNIIHDSYFSQESMFSMFFTENEGFALSNSIPRIITELLRYEYERTKHCSLEADTQNELNDIIENQSKNALTEFWLSNQDTKNYDNCIKNAVAQGGFNKEYIAGIELLNFGINMIDKDLTLLDLKEEFAGDEEMLVTMEAIRLVSQNVENYDISLIESDNAETKGKLILNGVLTGFTLNGKDCALNKKYCIDHSNNMFFGSGDEYIYGEPTSCMINDKAYQGEVCHHLVSQLSIADEFNNSVLKNSPGMGYLFWQMNAFLSSDKTMMLKSKDNDMYQSIKTIHAMNKKMSNKTVNPQKKMLLVLRKTNENNAQDAVWVVDSIDIMNKE